MLPANHQIVVRDGIAALRWAQEVLELRAAAAPEPEPLLLRIRDVAGLAGRLEDATADDWEQRHVLSVLSPQDLDVLAQWEQDSATLAGAVGRSRQFRALREMLGSYMEADQH
jgi:hypothetical protein